jgi:hypothetical protein
MTAAAPVSIGFLSAIEHDSCLLAGLLVLNLVGRPIEFHCTSPVKPTRSHEVIYGPTLRSFLLADHIAPTLIANLKTLPELFCCDWVEFTETPNREEQFVFLDSSENVVEDVPAHDSQQFRVDQPHAVLLGPRWQKLFSFQCAGRQLWLNSKDPARQTTVKQQVTELVSQIDLLEPFERIHNAIRESHGIPAREGTDAAQ